MAEYDAFVSYSHTADRRIAAAVREGLERLARRWNQRRALRVFQDTSGLGATPELWGTIQSALDSSRFFVVLASPEAAASPWVNKELAHFLANNDARRVLIAVTGGGCDWDDGTGDFDWDASTALPGSLRGAFTQEPLYVDLRWADRDVHLDLHNPRFKAAIADLAAEIHGVARDEIDARDLREFRKGRRYRRLAVAALAALTLAAAIAGVVAVLNAQEARRQQRVAETNASEAATQARTAAGRALMAGAQLEIEERPDLALLLGIHALELRPDLAARETLLQVLLQVDPYLQFGRDDDLVTTVAISPNEDLLVTGTGAGTLTVRDLTNDLSMGRILGSSDVPAIPSAIEFVADRRFVVLNHEHSIQLYGVGAEGAELTLLAEDDTVSAPRALDHNEQTRTLNVLGAERIALFDVDDGALSRREDVSVGSLGLRTDGVAGILGLRSSPDGDLLAVYGYGDLGLFSVDPTSGGWSLSARIAEGTRGQEVVTDVAFSADGRSLVTGSATRQTSDRAGQFTVWDLADPSSPAFVDGVDVPRHVRSVAVCDDRAAYATDDGAIAEYHFGNDASSAGTVFPVSAAHGTTTSMTCAPTGRAWISGGTDGLVQLRVLPPAFHGRPSPMGIEVRGLTAPSPGHDGVLIGRRQAELQVWRADGEGTPELVAAIDDDGETRWLNRHDVEVRSGAGVHVWDVENPALPVGSPTGAPDGSRCDHSEEQDNEPPVLDCGDVTIAYDGASGRLDLAVPAGDVVSTIPLLASPSTLAVDPRGELLFVGHRAFSASLWDIRDVTAPYEVATLDLDYSVQRAAFSPDGGTLAVEFYHPQGTGEDTYGTWLLDVGEERLRRQACRRVRHIALPTREYERFGVPAELRHEVCG